MKKLPTSSRLMESIAQMTYAKLFAVWVSLTISFAIAYWLLSLKTPLHGPITQDGSRALLHFGNSLYFSVMTATTTGYGDIVPQGFSKVLASLQSVISFFVFGVFITKLVANRQEMALQQVHRLTYEDVFHNTREGLYIIRKDFDHLMARAGKSSALSADEWEDLAIAYKQGQSLLQEIPDFYDEDAQLYVIDEQREELLQEAVHRTLHRIGRMLDAFEHADIDWMANARSFAELRELVKVAETVLPHWRDESPYQKPEAFEDIVLLAGAIRDRVGGMMG